MEKKNIGFWADMLRGTNGGISSKRVLGCFILIALLATIIISIFTGIESTWLGEAILTMEIGAFALLGISLFEKKTNPTVVKHYGDDDEENREEESNEEEDQTC